MEISDEVLMSNFDWDPVYLQEVVKQDFYEFNHLWCSDLTDMELVKEVSEMEKYCPITEDISLDDEVLCSTVEKIESE